jgi:hypothetical protein
VDEAEVASSWDRIRRILGRDGGAQQSPTEE